MRFDESGRKLPAMARGHSHERILTTSSYLTRHVSSPSLQKSTHIEAAHQRDTRTVQRQRGCVTNLAAAKRVVARQRDPRDHVRVSSLAADGVGDIRAPMDWHITQSLPWLPLAGTFLIPVTADWLVRVVSAHCHMLRRRDGANRAGRYILELADSDATLDLADLNVDVNTGLASTGETDDILEVLRIRSKHHANSWPVPPRYDVAFRDSHDGSRLADLRMVVRPLRSSTQARDSFECCLSLIAAAGAVLLTALLLQGAGPVVLRIPGGSYRLSVAVFIWSLTAAAICGIIIMVGAAKPMRWRRFGPFRGRAFRLMACVVLWWCSLLVASFEPLTS